MFRKQVATALIVLVLSATAFALTKSSPDIPASGSQDVSPSAPFGSVPPSRPEVKSPEIKSADWLAGQNAHSFTIQIFADTDGYVIPALIRQWTPKEPLIRYQIRHHGEMWHFLSYGVFPSADAARQAMAELPQSIGLFSPRVQPLRQVLARLHHTGDVADPAPGRSAERTTKSKRYAISLYSAETVNELRQFAREHGIRNAYYARAKGSVDPWVTLLKGAYSTLIEAQSDLDALPKPVRAFAWVKNTGSPNLEILSFNENPGFSNNAKTVGDSTGKDRQWISRQSRDGLTVLLATGTDQRRLYRVSARLGLAGQVHLITYPDGETKRYAAVTGSFTDYAVAQKKLDRIRRRVSSLPVIVTFGVLKDASNGDGESVTFLQGHDLVKTRMAKSETDSR